MTRKSKPWKLTYVTPGSLYEETHRSRPALYRAAEAERQRIADGISRVVGMTAYQWDPEADRWVRYERLPIAEADS